MDRAIDNVEHSNTIGVKLREIRQQRGLTRPEASRSAGIHYATLYRVEEGWHRPCFDLIERLADFYQVDPVPLLNQAGYPLPNRLKLQPASDTSPFGPLTADEQRFLAQALDAYRKNRASEPATKAVQNPVQQAAELARNERKR